MYRALVLATVSVALHFFPLPAHAQDGCAASIRITLEPERPRHGTLFVIRVHGGTDELRFGGGVAGEPLHFGSAAAGGAREALAAIPIDSSESLGAIVTCSAGATTDTLRATIPVSAGAYPLERLRVAPRFSEKPDSALQARMDLEARRAAAVSEVAHDTPRLWARPFVAPRQSRITSRFGRGREFNGTVTSRHMGTDYAGATGAPVRATNRGVVRIVDDFFLGGNVVYIDHGAGLVSAYLHLSEQLVSPGDTVKRGAVIGRVGATGRVTGPHLHFILRYGGISIDPQRAVTLLGDARKAAP